jgi:hypothetical protein
MQRRDPVINSAEETSELILNQKHVGYPSLDGKFSPSFQTNQIASHDIDFEKTVMNMLHLIFI